MSDPWQQAAQQYKSAQVKTGAVLGPQAKYAAEGVSNPPDQGAVRDTSSVADPWAANNNDLKLWQQNDAPQERFSTELVKEIPWAVKQLGIGALKEFGDNLSNAGKLVAHIPGVGGPALTQATAGLSGVSAPANEVQSIGKTGTGVGEFLIPGLGEESATGRIAEAAPKLAPLARVGYNALTSGIVNKAQGGEFGTGAMAGGGAGLLGEGMRAVAPHMAESALNIRKLDRAYGKGNGAIGRAILDETNGVRPGTVAASAQSRLDELNPRLEKRADEASVRRTPKVKGFLQPPAVQIPLARTPDVEGTVSRPVVLHQPDRPMARQLPAPKVETPLTEHPYFGNVPPDEGLGSAEVNNSRMGEPFVTPEGEPNYGFSDQFPSTEGKWTGGVLRRDFQGIPSSGMGPGEFIGQIPGERGGRGGVQGVFIRRPEMSASIPPATEPNRVASLRGARAEIGSHFGKAARQGERTTMSQLAPMAVHLAEDVSGNPVAADVTPRQLLDLKRGFGNEFIHRWNPETMEGVKGTAARAYHALGEEFNNAVPGARELNGRISRLIPITKRAESTELNAPTEQRMAHRIGAHTGALTGGVFGAGEGYRKDGVPGAIAGAALGIALPEMIASPTGEMIAARTFNSGSKYIPRLMAGTGLQLDRKPKEK